MAHRVIEWDGWEEGLADSILGPSDQEDEWFKSWEGDKTEDNFDAETQVATDGSPRSETSPTLTGSESEGESAGGRPLGKPKIPLVAKVVAAEKEKEKLLKKKKFFISKEANQRSPTTQFAGTGYFKS